MEEHIRKLRDEAYSVPYNSTEYWKLRTAYLEKFIDPTYGEAEQTKCYLLWSILRNRVN